MIAGLTSFLFGVVCFSVCAGLLYHGRSVREGHVKIKKPVKIGGSA